eukprot:1610735-Ditylum_brightwellii.AAC.1
MRVGVENTSGVTDTREQIEYAAEYEEEKSTVATGRPPPFYDRLCIGSNPWPEEFQPTLQPCTSEYIAGVLDVAHRLREALCASLLKGVAVDELSNMFHPRPHWAVKLISYPPYQASGNDNCQGVGPHTDTNFLTLVLQDDVGGLQVFAKGKWIDVPTHGPDVLVCNLGEQAEILSDGYFLATPHRVIRRSSDVPRISVPFFYNPKLSAKIRPTASLSKENDDKGSFLPWERPAQRKHWRMKNNSMLQTVGDNTFKSLARSHPTVFEKHHSDLCILGDGRIVKRGEK